jgi:gliding motility-associated-like protein
MMRFFPTLRTWIIVLSSLFSMAALAQPKANFTISSTAGCSPLTVKFTNTTTGGTAPYTYLWRLGNTNLANTKDAGAIYILCKTYNVTLIVTDNAGKIDSITKPVTVYCGPKADFKVDVVKGCPPFDVTFTDASTAGSSPITSWLWDFDDGSTSTLQNPGKHTYTKTGIFSVTLDVTDGHGCTNHIKKTSLISSINPPTIDFTASPQGGCNAPVSINFSSSVSPASLYTYSWDFGDGGTSTDPNPGYKYTSNGSYTVTLKVSDNAGCTTTKIKNGFIFIGKPTADFSYSPNKGCSPLDVNFTDKTVGASQGTAYLWDFGDGTKSTAQNPTHSYSPGTYSVKMIVKSPAGCLDSVIKQNIITVTPGFKPSFTSDSILCQKPYSATFKNTSGNSTSVLLWEFGDNTTSSQQQPTHTYPDSGGYFKVTMTVSDGKGCTETISEDKAILAQATAANIGYSQNEGCAPYVFNFTNNSSSIDPITSYKWSFGDGTFSTLSNPGSHTYKDTGYYTVSLKVVTSKGCTSSANAIVNVGSKPTANFSATPISGCLNNLRHVHFSNLTNTSGNIKADRYIWNFGDGQTSTVASPTYRYTIKPGKYDVTLVAFNKGCADTMRKKQFIVIKGPWANYTVKRDGCVKNVVSFFDSSINANRVKYVFDDGTSDTSRNPIHTYAPGSYKPYQIVYNDTTGCSDTFSLYLPPNDPLNIGSPWSASITSQSTLSGCLPLSVDFKLSDNDSADNVVYFGDGDSVTVSSINNPIQTVSHTYVKKGSFNVKVKATNVRGCQQKFAFSQTIIATGATAKFTIDRQGGCVPLKILLSDSSTKDNTIVKKVYDMGNGDILDVTRDTMSYTYLKPPQNQYGGFTITEKVTDISGCTNFYTANVFPSLPAAAFNLDSNITCKQTIYSFVPTDDGFGPFKYNWDLGNGNKSSLRSPVLTYKNGQYTVHLTMTDANGCTDTASKTFFAYKSFSKADFKADTNFSQCPPFHVFFNDKSKFAYGGFRGYEWDFGDGSPHSFLSNPQKVYYDAGVFDVKLIITDSLGCTDSILQKGAIIVKGAIGTYSFDVNRGCTPLTVHFRAISKNASKFLWDMGDGNLKEGDTVTYTYTGTRTYVPLLILSDSNGCTYSLQPKDTIHVDALPIPDFTYDSICSGSPTYFVDASSASAGKLVSWIWDFGDGSTGSGPTPSHIYQKNGYYVVSLTVANSQGCSKKGLKKIRIGGIKADFSSGRTGCVGYPVTFTDNSVSDTTIRSWKWLFGDGSTDTVQNPTHTYFSKGRYKVTLFVDNYKDCFDSISKGGYQVIGDTVAPPPPVLYHVSVVDDNSVEVAFSRYKDVDFDHYRIYIKDAIGNFNEIDRTYNINDTAHIVKNLNTLHSVYCFKVQAVNACGKVSTLTPYHCTMDLTATPGKDKALLSWTPYIGWNKVARYKIYRMSYYTPPAYRLIDSVDGNTLNYTDTTVLCYRTDTYRIKALEDSGYYQASWSDTSTTKPEHVNRVPAANLLTVTVPDNKNIQVQWKDTPTIKVKYWLVEKSNDGLNYYLVDSPFTRNILSLTDKYVNVQRQSYYYRMRIMDSCGDLGPYSDYGKSIKLRTDTTIEVKPHLHWSAYLNWPEGVKYYDIEIQDANGNYNVISRTNSGKDSDYVDNITDLNSLPHYCYRVVAHRDGPPANPDQNIDITSISNESCLKVKSRIYLPNAFTPFNHDGINDSFVVKGLYIRDYHIKIFDRWGTKVFESNSLKNSWDGRYQHGKPMMDMYKYEIFRRGVDNQVYFVNGNVTILE